MYIQALYQRHRSGTSYAFWRPALALILLVNTSQLYAAPAFTLPDVIENALRQNPTIDIARAQEEAAQAAVTTAKSYLNPEVEAGVGPSRNRSGTHEVDKNWGLTLSQ